MTSCILICTLVKEFYKVKVRIVDMLSFLKEVRSELEKVTFPTRKEAMRLTGIVIVISVFVGLFIGFSDLLLTKILEIVIK